MRTVYTTPGSSADSGDEVDFALRRNRLEQSDRADFAVHCDRDVGAETAFDQQPLADAGIDTLQIVDDLADGGALHLQR